MKYSKSLVDKILKLYEAGNHSIEDICLQCNIHKDTFYHWKNTKPDFSDALKSADEKRNDSFKMMAKSGLAKLLDVYEYEEVTTEYENDPQGKPKVKAQKRVKKIILPSATAVIFALTNREPDHWKHKQNIDHTTDGKGFFEFLTEASQEENGEE